METVREKKARMRKIMGRLASCYPGARTALLHDNPLELLVATILSAQCTDERVNAVTPGLFQRYRTAAEFARARRDELESLIRSTGFYRAKANNIMRCCEEIAGRHGGEVPRTMEELVKLPGVGRKTANVVLGSAFGKAEGVVVDTHVKRLSGLMKLSASATPEKIEIDLMELVPRKDWILFPHLLILHGRKVCKARKPLCGGCAVSGVCPSVRR
ncbi:MAG TPA: endonuclease III [Bacteroidota bacterium]|nr:endonuclease III [Bacteroidota bacterium]